jgi:hypothetical protein
MEKAARSEIEIDFVKGTTGEATKYIVQKHAKTMVETIMKDINTFSLKQNLKMKAFQQLYTLIVCAESKVQDLSEKILKLLFKFILDEDPEVSFRCLKIAQLLGFYIDADYLIPLILNHIKD